MENSKENMYVDIGAERVKALKVTNLGKAQALFEP